MTVEQEVNQFFEQVGLNKPSVPEIQRQEMRRAFFAGQWAMFTFQMTELCRVDDSSAERMLAARQREIETFFKSNFQQRN